MTETPAPRTAADLAISLIRTWVPIVVGSALGWLASSQHLVLPAGASATAGVLAAGACAAGYYALARVLENANGAGTVTRAVRFIGRYMLGGVLPPTYHQVPPPPG